MNLGRLLNLPQVSYPWHGVNFALVYSLMSITVHMSFSLPGATSRGRLPVVQHWVIHFAKVTFPIVHRTQKLPQAKSNLAHAHYFKCLAVAWWPGGRVLKSKGGAKIGNCQCEISYKICKVQLVNRFKVIVILAFL